MSARYLYVLVVAPFLVWGLAEGSAALWIEHLDMLRPLTFVERLLVGGARWTSRKGPLVAMAAILLAPVATLVCSYVVRPPAEPPMRAIVRWAGAMLASWILAFGVFMAEVWSLMPAVLASSSCCYGMAIARAYHAQQRLVSDGRSRMPASIVPWMSVVLQSIDGLLGLTVILLPVLAGRYTKASGGAVQQADAADEARSIL